MRRLGSAASSHAKKLAKLTVSVFWPRFNSSKCKMAAKMAVARIKLLRNKREVVVRQMRCDIASLLRSGRDDTARIRVEHVIREQNVLAANEFIELFCELIVSRLPIIAKQRECPADLKEGISSLLFAGPRCSEIPELIPIRKIFEKKYGSDFVSAAIDLRPSSGVNRMLIDKLSVRTPSGEVKLKVLKEIAKEYQVDWDISESEKELLKPPEQLIDGPDTFAGAANLPVAAPMSLKTAETYNQSAKPTNGGGRGNNNTTFEDAASAAVAAAESAKEAIAAAAQAAALANKDSSSKSATAFDHNISSSRRTSHGGFEEVSMSRDHRQVDQQSRDHYQGFGRWVTNDCHMSHDETGTETDDAGTFNRRRSHSPSSSSPREDLDFDESDYDEEIEMEEPPAGVYRPPDRSPPPVPSSRASLDPIAGAQVHPKLPDFDALSARFEALKYSKS